MFKRMIVAVITFAAMLCSGTVNANADNSAKTFDDSLAASKIFGTEVEYLARDGGTIGNGNGRPEKPDVWTVKPVEPRPPVTEQTKPPTSETVNQPQPINTFADTYNPNDTWLIQWYVCGTDLESDKGGLATNDLIELLNVKLPDNVKVLIQTGGSTQWQNDVIRSDAIGRYIYKSDGLYQLEILQDADMGHVNTLADFIRYGTENFQADHRIFVFWDHGGGSVNGFCVDGRTGNRLRLNDLTKAFGSVYNASAENPPFEMIGFDTCLMATYDTINSLNGFARYIVASEEVEPGLGWNYTGWLGALANNPAMGGAKLGKEICDSYISACTSAGEGDTATLSVIDMTKLPQLRNAYENFGAEALVKAYKNPRNFFSSFGRGALNAENYANNWQKNSFSHMIDIADLARCNQNLLSGTANTLINSVESAVVYKVYGRYRSRGGGISSFYPYINDENPLNGYISLDGAPAPQKLLYYYRIYGDLPDEIKPTLEQLASQVGDVTATTPVDNMPAPVATQGKGIFDKTFKLDTPPAQRQNFFDISSLEDLPVDVDKDGNAFVTLTQEQMDLISSVHCQLMYVGEKENLILYLGSDTDIKADWKTGKFMDNFRNVWPMLDGHPVYVEITENSDGYNIYSIPIKLNGIECNLKVSYVYADQKYYILGASRGLDENGMSYRELIQLKPGDEITTIHYVMTISGDDENFTPVEVDTFTVGDNPTVSDTTLGNGKYAYFFEFISPNGDSALSKIVNFTVDEDGKITTSVE